MAIGKASVSLLHIAENTGEAPLATELDLGEAKGFHEFPCSHGAPLLRVSQSALRRLNGLVIRPDLREVGGLLIGTVTPDRAILTLLDVVAVTGEHRFGPAFRPSEADLQSFAREVAKSFSASQTVIGYFRSSLEDPISLREEDETLLRRFFEDGGCSVVLVQVGRLAELSTASFCHWDGKADVRPVQRLRLKPAGTPVLKQAARPVVAPPPVTKPEATKPEAPKPEAAKPEAPKPEPISAGSKPPRFKSLYIVSGAVVTVLAIFALGRFSAPRQPVADTGVLEMSLEPHDLLIEVKWNPASQAFRDAERGGLVVVDGGAVRRIDLNRAQLHSGRYILVPANPDLTCQMTVYRNQDAFVGATRNVHIDLPPTLTPTSPAVSEPLQAKASTGKLPPATPDRTPRQTRSFTPPPVATRARPIPAPAPALEQPPDIVSTAASPIIPQVFTRARLNAVPAPGPARPALLDPVPITRVSPSLPPAMRIEIRRPVLIHVAVQIDREGKVTGARPLDANDLIARMLAPYALQAARLWRFEPALRDGARVASDTVVAFKFAQNM